jgi:hypothetical protein
VQQRAAAQLARAETLEQQLIQTRKLPETKRKPRAPKTRRLPKPKKHLSSQMAANGHKRTLNLRRFQSMQIDKPKNRSAPLAIIRRQMLTESEPTTDNVNRTHP